MSLDTYEAIYREAADLIDEPENFKDNPEYVRALCELVARCSELTPSTVHKDDVLARLKANKEEA